jgi:hypothetical protein
MGKAKTVGAVAHEYMFKFGKGAATRLVTVEVRIMSPDEWEHSAWAQQAGWEVIEIPDVSPPLIHACRARSS